MFPCHQCSFSSFDSLSNIQSSFFVIDFELLPKSTLSCRDVTNVIISTTSYIGVAGHCPCTPAVWAMHTFGLKVEGN